MGAAPQGRRQLADTQRRRVDFYLRSHHAQYLERIADRDDSSLSSVLDRVIDAHMEIVPEPAARGVKRERKHLFISTDRLSYIDRLALAWGLQRAEVVQRLIEKALALEVQI